MQAVAKAERLSRIIRKIRNLPTLPSVFYKVQEALRAPDASAATVARIIESDQSVASKVLRLVNSSYFSFSREITSLRQAVVMLGFNAVRNALLTISVVQTFPDGDDKQFDRRQFWIHALATAATSRYLSQKWRAGIDEEAYAAGILHDIGKIIFDQYNHDEFVRCLQMSRSESLSLFDVERKIIGVTHADVGEYLSETWRLPVKLTEGIALHHRPKILRSEPKLVAIVHLANSMVRQMSLGDSGDHGPISFESAALEELEVTEDDVQALIPKLEEEFERNEDFFAVFN